MSLVVTLHVVALAGLAGILTQWVRAERQTIATQAAAARARQQLVDMHIANGVRAVEADDLLGALPWFAEAARLAPGQAVPRLCLANTLRAAPRLVGAWALDAPVTDAAWTPDGGRIIAGAESGRVILAVPGGAAAPGRPVFSVSLDSGLCRIAVAPDGDTVALAGADGRTFLLDLSDHSRRALPSAAAGVRALAFSPDGRWLAAGGGDSTARVWQVNKPDLPPRTHAHQGVVTSVAFSPDSALLLSAALDGTAALWRTADGTQAGPSRRSSEGLFVAAFAPDGRQFLLAGAGGDARLWKVGEPRVAGAPMNHSSWVNWAAFSPSGRYLATGSEDATARLWDAADGRPLTPPLRHQGGVTCGAFDGREVRLATACRDQEVRLWSVPEGVPLGAPLRHGGVITQVAWQPHGRLLLTASRDGFLRVWDPEPAASGVLLAEGFTSWNVWFETGSDRFIASGPGGQIRLWRAADAQPASPLLPHPELVDHALLSPDGGRLLTACRDHQARVWDAVTGQVLGAVALSNHVHGIAWRPDGRACAAFTDEPFVHVFEATSNRASLRFATPGSPVSRVAFSPDGRWLAAGCQDGAVLTWDLQTGATAFTVRPHREPVCRLEFNPGGQTLLTAGRDGIARLLDAQTGVARGAPMSHTDALEDARFDPAGQRVVTAGRDGTARIWNATDGRPLAPPMRPHGGVLDARFSPDGRWVLTRNADAVQVWHAATATLVRCRFAPEQPVAGAGFSPDSTQLWVVSERPQLHRLDLKAGEWSDEDWQFAARFLSCREVDATGGLVARFGTRAAAGATSTTAQAARWAELEAGR